MNALILKKESSRICGVNFDSPKSVTTVVAVQAIVWRHVQDSNEKEFYFRFYLPIARKETFSWATGSNNIKHNLKIKRTTKDKAIVI